MERNTVERAVKKETDAKGRIKKKGVSELYWFMSKDTNRDIPTT